MITTALNEYLERNSHTVDESLHDRLLKDITVKLIHIINNTPEKFYHKVDLMESDRRVGIVDLVALTGEEMYIIQAIAVNQNRAQARGNDLSRLRQKLWQGYEYLKRFDVAPKMVGIYRRFGTSQFQSFEIQRPIEDLMAKLK